LIWSTIRCWLTGAGSHSMPGTILGTADLLWTP
jgi:hypothetical protein